MHFPVKNMIFIMIKQTGLKVSRYDHKHEDIEENNNIELNKKIDRTNNRGNTHETENTKDR